MIGLIEADVPQVNFVLHHSQSDILQGRGGIFGAIWGVFFQCEGGKSGGILRRKKLGHIYKKNVSFW